MKYLGKKIITLIMTLFLVSAATRPRRKESSSFGRSWGWTILLLYGISIGRRECSGGIWESAIGIPKT